ncbi:hypothetical protein NGA35_01395 [Pseudomonas stutzeri]|nr:hypothetical protein [Stutzerimonas stutzeri]
MRWPATRRPSTRELLRAEHRPRLAGGGNLWRGSLLLLLALIAAAFWLRLDERAGHERQQAALRAEISSLAADLQRSQLQLREAQASEAQLLRRIEELSAQTKRLKTDLAFFRQQKKRQ